MSEIELQDSELIDIMSEAEEPITFEKMTDVQEFIIALKIKEADGKIYENRIEPSKVYKLYVKWRKGTIYKRQFLGFCKIFAQHFKSKQYYHTALNYRAYALEPDVFDHRTELQAERLKDALKVRRPRNINGEERYG